MHTKPEILVAFGEIVRAFRKAKGFSQEELADQSGLHRTYIGMIERGEKNLTLVSISKIAEALQISMSELFANLSQ